MTFFGKNISRGREEAGKRILSLFGKNRWKELANWKIFVSSVHFWLFGSDTPI